MANVFIHLHYWKVNLLKAIEGEGIERRDFWRAVQYSLGSSNRIAKSHQISATILSRVKPGDKIIGLIFHGHGNLTGQVITQDFFLKRDNAYGFAWILADVGRSYFGPHPLRIALAGCKSGRDVTLLTVIARAVQEVLGVETIVEGAIDKQYDSKIYLRGWEGTTNVCRADGSCIRVGHQTLKEKQRAYYY